MAEFPPKVERGTMLVIRCDGSQEVISGAPSIVTIKKAIGADTLDFVNLTWETRYQPDLVMAVDDAGYEFEIIDRDAGKVISREEEMSRLARGGHFEHRPIHNRKPFNMAATALYHAICAPGTTHKIVGDVAILHDRDSGT